MKKKMYLLFASIMLAVSTMFVPATATAKVKTQPTEQQVARLQQIKDRAQEIQSMNLSSLSSQERQDLRNEVKAMKKEAKAMNGGVYLSVGAIIIILLVLILLLN